MSRAPAALLADDPAAVAQAVALASYGQTVCLVDANGRAVAEVRPPADADRHPRLGAEASLGDSDRERAERIVGEFMTAAGAMPGLDDYRRVYDKIGVTWPGDDEVRRRYPVA